MSTEKNPKQVDEELNQTFGGHRRPSEYMRARRPYLFSDSRQTFKPALSKDLLQYILDNITHRKQEYDFEHFCRQMAQKEICKNLIPQTGPTGGGDSKTDTETHPVAESVHETWFEGNANAAGSEKWAFAFSAKKDWRSKAKSDVDKIVATDRGYRHIFFATNQFVPDKKRVETEQELSDMHGVPVTILDRNWLVCKVFENNRIQLAIEALKISEANSVEIERTGPKDAERLEELEQIEAQIEDDTYYQGVEYQRVEDCLQAAILSRGLEYPRAQVEGRFIRAQRLADKNNVRQQKLRVAYQRAWTAHFWYDDIQDLDTLYGTVEALALNSEHISDIEMLANLWHLLNAAKRNSNPAIEESKFTERTVLIRKELERIASYEDRPNAALQAKTLGLLIRVGENLPDGNNTTEILEEFETIFKNSEGMLEYPLESIISIFQELGIALSDNEEYDRIIEFVAEIQSRRHKNAASGEILLNRGIQKIEARKPFDAIRFLGKAINHLGMEETQKDFVFALFSCGVAYESVGLLWAARANYVGAANQALKEFREKGKFIPPAFLSVRKLVWIELQLGRVWPVLSWMELQAVMAPGFTHTEEKQARYKDEWMKQKTILGILLLKSKLEDLKHLNQLPAFLEKYGLWESEMALRYALGDVEKMRLDETLPKELTDDDVLDFFGKWIHQPASEDVPEHPEFYLGRTVTIRTSILGCKIEAITENDQSSIEIGEMILAALEAFLATSADELFTYKPSFRISVKKSNDVKTVAHVLGMDGEPIDLLITHPPGLSIGTPQEREIIRDWVVSVVVDVTSKIMVSGDLGKHIVHLAKEEEVIGRAFNFVATGTAVANILGADQKRCVSDWPENTDLPSTPLQRNAIWSESLRADQGVISKEKEQTTENDSTGLGEMNPKVHRERLIASIINIPLWNAAKWRGALYMLAEDGYDAPPYLGLAFYNPAAGLAIFEEWQRTIGMDDKDELIDVTIITGISSKNPFHYKIMVSMNTDTLKGKAREILIPSRTQLMEPNNSRNLDLFLRMYGNTGVYYLIPAWIKGENLPPEPLGSLRIKKKKITVIPAWKITENGFHMMALDLDDDPIIPEGEVEIPVWRALERVREFRDRKIRD